MLPASSLPSAVKLSLLVTVQESSLIKLQEMLQLDLRFRVRLA